MMISVMNGRRMGGGFQMTPESKPDDGMFDLCIAEAASKSRILQMIPHFIKRDASEPSRNSNETR